VRTIETTQGWRISNHVQNTAQAIAGDPHSRQPVQQDKATALERSPSRPANTTSQPTNNFHR